MLPLFLGMSERAEHDHTEHQKDLPEDHATHHDHSDNIDVADLVTDTEHMLDDLGDWYTKDELRVEIGMEFGNGNWGQGLGFGIGIEDLALEMEDLGYELDMEV